MSKKFRKPSKLDRVFKRQGRNRTQYVLGAIFEAFSQSQLNQIEKNHEKEKTISQ